MSTTATKPAKTAAANDAVEYKISEATNTLGSLYAKHLTVNKDGSVAIEGDVVHDNLPEDMTLASIKAHQKYRGQVVAALTAGLGEKALPILAKNPGLDKVTMSTKFGNDKIELSVERSREFGDGKGGKVVKPGYVNLGYTVSGATNAGEFKNVRARLGDEAKKLFGG